VRVTPHSTTPLPLSPSLFCSLPKAGQKQWQASISITALGAQHGYGLLVGLLWVILVMRPCTVLVNTPCQLHLALLSVGCYRAFRAMSASSPLPNTHTRSLFDHSSCCSNLPPTNTHCATTTLLAPSPPPQIGLSQAKLMSAFHPDALYLLQMTSDLQYVTTKLADPNTREPRMVRLLGFEPGSFCLSASRELLS